MDDRQIVELFLKRSERAIEELAVRYERLLLSIARNMLGNEEDAAECVNDTYLGVWNAIPPHQPENLPPFVCRIAKNLSLKRLRSRRTVKRGSFYEVSLEELGEVLGRYDGDGQREALAHTRAELSRALEQAREAREKQGRMYQVLGITAGAFLVILLL